MIILLISTCQISNITHSVNIHIPHTYHIAHKKKSLNTKFCSHQIMGLSILTGKNNFSMSIQGVAQELNIY